MYSAISKAKASRRSDLEERSLRQKEIEDEIRNRRFERNSPLEARSRVSRALGGAIGIYRRGLSDSRHGCRLELLRSAPGTTGIQTLYQKTCLGANP